VQLPFAYEPGDAGRRSWLVMLETLRAAVSHLGPKHVEHELDISKSTLSESLNEQRDRRWAGEWTHVVLAMLDRQHTPASDDLVRRILDAQAALSTRFVIADRSDEPTPEEVAAAERVIAKVRGRKRAA
jgi:hypothetical protein